ncbi:putative ATP-dependent helicase YprA isoform X1 [Cucumis melo var. makuwa]|uniref:Putative ATP-dependent helicase YprA isoform X1 n=1 Tax=Cucumis melo var. makuwa TaxID=1194695 RepID=A0A5D3BGJ3_CUCMM|nr:putative ATP-dependent helicase YprA isoform X1 [Cucumis melo var. makuwa]
MEESEREIRIKTLTGESMTVSVSGNSTIDDLKLLLRRNFPSATISPNFHLFFKGTKLKPQSQISACCIDHGEFLVLIPFNKKESSKSRLRDQYELEFSVSSGTSISQFADSAWSDMVQDLSYLHGCSVEGREETVSESERASSEVGEVDAELEACCSTSSLSSKAKGKLGFGNDGLNGSLDDVLRNFSLSPTEGFLNEQTCESFIKFLESVDCLTDPRNGNCMLAKQANSRSGNKRAPNSTRGSSCLCPTWLKKIMKAFSFLNVFSMFLQLQEEIMTVSRLEQAMDQLQKRRIMFCMEDIHNLSRLCPKAVHFASGIMEDTRVHKLIIIIYLTEKNGRPKKDIDNTDGNATIYLLLRIPSYAPAFLNFNIQLGIVVSLLEIKMGLLKHGSGREMCVPFSLEALITSNETDVDGSETKRAKKSDTASSSSQSERIRCHDTSKLLPENMVEHLKKSVGPEGQIVHVNDILARKANYVEIPKELSNSVVSALKCIGVAKLYSHQARSIEASLSGKHVAVATMTSSGKSLCYNLPVLEAMSQDVSSCALYLFPTKALAQDQLRSLLVMMKGFIHNLNIGVYDGDTSQADRILLRDNARLLITNPDMLHVSILPHHRQFSRILSNLRFIVIDEAHTYKGAFGCHTALILRRLRRICSHVYGSDPSFIFCTATSANPREHCMELGNLSSLELIDNDGSPSARKLFLLWNPVMVLFVAQLWTLQGSLPKWFSMDFAALLFVKLANFVSLFYATRRREILKESAPHLVQSVCAYRAGYTAEDRRRIESDFFGGNLCGVAATNALELGIDVGHIDATLHLGFPGSIASLWQQAGRAGRREKTSLSVYVAFEGPLDQYFMKHPEKLFGSPIECCHIDAENQQVLEQHLLCAAYEHPVCVAYDQSFFGPGLNNALMSLKNRGDLIPEPSCGSSKSIWNYIGQEKMPSRSVSIRAIEAERYKVVDQRRNEVLEEIEESKAFFQVFGYVVQVYEGAVYMHQGRTYLVKSLNLSTMLAFCEEADLKYYTKTRDYTDIHVIGAEQAVWIPVPQSIKEEVKRKNFDFRAGLHAASHALLNVVPLRIICNMSDLAPECANPHDTRYFPERILLYDQHPGGTGMSLQIQPVFIELLNAAFELLTSCRCLGETGCPNCVQSLACHEYNEVLHKDAASLIIKGVLDAEKAYCR